ncbi:MAG: glycosyltransferase involved in cell wall biosynthesis [Bacteroidia bacterium]|jgi:glycosyltransferase involved in cell wall biosynthesis
MNDVSIVIPLFNEEESLPELTTWISKVMESNKYSYEVVFIDDGSTDKSWKVVEQLKQENDNIKGIKFRRNYGKSAALNEGFKYANGNVVITMDADLQDSPEEIPGLYSMIMKDGYDMVSGWKKKRYDPITKTIPTKLYNYVTSRMSGVKLHDMNCGLKAYKLEVVQNIEVYGEMHRYIPVIAKWAGFGNIGEKVVQHQARKFGTTKFGLSRFIYGPLDLLSIMFVGKFGKRPMHLFGALGSMFFLGGFVIASYLSIAKLVWQEYEMTSRPLFYLGILAMIIGVQLFVAGFLGELISRSAGERNRYQIQESFGITQEL